MPKVKGQPVRGGQRLGSYNDQGAGIGDSGAICEQMRHMQRDMQRMMRNAEELQDMTRQMLGSMQQQHRAVETLIKRVDKASSNSDESVKKISDAAAAMEGNTDMIVRAAITLAHAQASQDEYEAAKARADKEIQEWKAEQRGLKIVSSGE